MNKVEQCIIQTFSCRNILGREALRPQLYNSPKSRRIKKKEHKQIKMVRSASSHILLLHICFIFLSFSSPSCANSGDLDALLKLKNAMNTGHKTSGSHVTSNKAEWSLLTSPTRDWASKQARQPHHRWQQPNRRLPAAMANLTCLKHLNISNNIFIGPFPGEIFLGMPELEVLDAYNNQFSGQLPPELASCKRLKHLQMGGNYFTGEIPENYSNIQSLEYLGLNGNWLTGKLPASLALLKNLKELYVGYFNSFDGGIPPELGSLTWLQVLDLASCNLSGSIPRSLGLLKHLGSLFLQVNCLNGFIPPELSGMASLMALDLSINKLTGEIPESFSELKSISLLNLQKNNLYGSIPDFIGHLPHLEVLNLWENNFTFELPESLGRNGRLVDLDVTGNHLTGLIPQDLCRGGRLKALILMDNHFFGPIPEELGQCKSLVKIRMMKNRITGTVPVGIFNLPNVVTIELNENYLSGQLPTQMYADSLAILTLSGNQISGVIPRAIGNLNNLQTLSLEMNKFYGKIPKEIFYLKWLSKINISINNLGGEIPASISNCSSLTFLDFSRNNLVGEIPRGTTKLEAIQLVNFSRNQLTGQIPDEIRYITSLTTLDLSYNNFTGTIPQSSQFLAIVSFEGNPYLCRNVSCPSLINQRAREHNAFGSPSKLALIIIGPLLVLLLIILLIFLFVKVYRITKMRKIQKSKGWRLIVFQQLHLNVEDLLQCLKLENIIGKGSAGVVYRGTMPSGLDVAIKQLVGSSRGGQRDHGFSAEIKTLGQIKHRNIVRLLGYMSNNESNLLLYEYMPNGSLGKLLHGPNAAELQWERRYKIAVEAAKGLCYLHHDCSPLIIHGMSSPITSCWTPTWRLMLPILGSLSTFKDLQIACLPLLVPLATSPQYGYTLKVDEKIDVYSFGVVLLELITGRKPVMNLEDEDMNIVSWVRKTTSKIPYKPSPASPAVLLALVDPKLSGYPLQGVLYLFNIAMMCVENDSCARPTMRAVVNMLTNPPPSSPTERLTLDSKL
ncbi:Leucine-rich receptor-like protein kinase family protein [Prunus dulcis]|uniref:non-specific serine/threonine protein kinase n=1 Tax=Prunus dulcis TaxID=3755 RepID=A0A4Y1RNV5_PRUDU|nr:Leucine-rich receptor-like protein kinase family protein [Prunus dulcis]